MVHKSEIHDIYVNKIIEFRDVLFEDIFSYKKKEDKTSEKKSHETAFKDKGPNEPIVNVEVEPKRTQRSRISKIL